MALNLENKKTMVASMKEAINGAETMVVANYKKVTVSEITPVRKNARSNEVYFHVMKNTLARIAVTGTQFEKLKDHMTGQMIYSISKDPVAAAKVVHEFSKSCPEVKIVAGVYNDKLLSEAEIKSLAAIPSKPELLSMVLGVMQQVPASFARVVQAIKTQKEEANS